MPTKSHLLLLTCVGLLPQAMADEITRLASPDINVRRAAVEAIQTLEDPRIPAACLPLLSDEGRSTRRQAARAIGSRFYDVPRERRGVYIEALRKCAADQPTEGTAIVCERAIGLLNMDYSSSAFSVGPKKKWVIYERRKLPVIAPVKGGDHHLLSPVWLNHADEKELLKLAVTNEPAGELFSPHWHPGGEAVAFTMKLQRRFFHPILIWSADAPAEVKVIEPKSLKPLLPSRYPNWGTTSDFVRWEGGKAIIRIYDCDAPDGPIPDDPGVFISYDIKTRETALMGK